jgi:alkylation response protein AidB-like acyl-CoA dehydrogenase
MSQAPTSPVILLEQERKNASFKVEELSSLFDDSEEMTKAKKIMLQLIERDPVFNPKNFYDLTREEQRANVMAQIRRAAEIKSNLRDPNLIKAFNYWLARSDRAYSMKVYVHEGLFRESIFTQGTNEQWQQWKDDIDDWRVIGCFAMTELGHSSFLRGIETTATYDKDSQEFIINTTSLTGTKWWIGAAGQTATHTVALCKLIIDNKDCGIHWFIVQLRDRDTGRLLPGVTAGDVGAKIARNGLDNGWIQFSNVRIPRQNMLMKWAQVSSDGKYTPPENPAISYNTLITERLISIGLMMEVLSAAIIIAVRYGVVREQGANNEKIMDYQSHQWNLMPILAQTYCYTILHDTLRLKWQELLDKQYEEKEKFLEAIPYWHAVSAGLKAWNGWAVADSLEIVRRSLGGHAYSAYSGIGTIIADYAVTTTGAGDNIVMAQQTTRYLLSALKNGSNTGYSFFGNAKQYLSITRFEGKVVYDSFNVIVDAFKWLCIRLLTQAGKILREGTQSGANFESVWNKNIMEVIPGSRIFSYIVNLETFYEFIEKAKQKKANSSIIEVLNKLVSVLAVSYLLKESGLFMEHGYFDGSQTKAIRNRFSALCSELRRDAVPLVDAFGYPDFILKSSLGRYDGDIYNHYFQTVREAPGCVGVPSYFEESIAPLTRTSKL